MFEKSQISLKSVSVGRPGIPRVLVNQSWELAAGEVWAITGAMACGKTTLLETLAGRHRLTAGSIGWPGLNEDPGRIRMVSFREQSRAFSYRGHYYQQRFEYTDDPDMPRVGAFLAGGSSATTEEVAAMAERFGLTACLHLPFIALSNGQTRRARLARALLAKPAVLLLDDPTMGLDVAGQAELNSLLQKMVGDGLSVVLTAREKPQWIVKHWALPGESHSATTNSELPLPIPTKPTSTECIVELRDVTVTHGGRRILDGLSWTIHRGDRWALLGANGSGKTTLLSLLCGDHPRAFGEQVFLFGRRRGTGETLWEIKARIGLVSPEFHVYFEEPLTVQQTIASGLSDTLVPPRITPEQAERIFTLLKDFEITALADRPFQQLSTGQQRLVLLLRALIKQPELLILDEPFQAFDEQTMQRARQWLAEKLLPHQTLIFVTHDLRELPATITHSRQLSLIDPEPQPIPACPAAAQQ